MQAQEEKKLNHGEVWQKFAPYDEAGKQHPPKVVAKKIAEWSIYFFGDKEQKAHYHIRGSVPQFHKDIYMDLASDYKYYYISAPSEFSKTTIATLIYPLYRTVYFNEPYIVISSRVDDTAMEMLDEIKNELRYNEKFKEVYGALLPLPDERGKDRYKKKDSAHVIELTNGTVIRSVGWGGNVRGRKRQGYRITLFIGDDPEELDDLMSETVLKKHIKWLKRSALPRMDKEYGKARVVGTRIGIGCTIDNLMKDPRWEGRVYKALVPDDKPIDDRVSIWEERWPTVFLHKERKAAMAAGELDDWMFERMNEPVSSLVKNLKGYKLWRGEFEHRNGQNLLHLEGWIDPIPVYTYHAIDPAFSQALNADERAQVTFCMGYIPMADWQKPCIWVLEYDFDHKDPSEVIERALDLHKKYFYRELVVETVGTQKIYEFLGVKQMAKDPFLVNHPLSLQPVNYHPRSKEDRIFHRFKNYIKLQQLFVHPDHTELQIELDNFLQSPHLHLLDALEMGCQFAIPCNESVQLRNTNSKRQYRIEDDLERELTEQGKQWMLW